MRRIIIGFVIVALSLIAAATWLLRSRDSVAVNVVNSSGQSIQWAKLTHENGAQMLGAIPVGESRRVEFRPHGETTFQITVRFADSSQLSGGDTYAEAGYAFTDTVTDSAITTRIENLGY